ncbi:unnamed protein product [Rotaria socialis]|uniref:protein-tyrosine-phosphatase n=1 Tax=Rotaria socialis TaxID=392032 RepID=A0A820NED9_9BILA|nr:unnamed protein product [Rotaria socialis]CAF3557839.1 unnamed protein product [Rotaria socialis]CAF4134674.1 unnamed protein product [Rotaria socialis]CAF4390192.1 unnamed protein product [Rotaria socialis]
MEFEADLIDDRVWLGSLAAMENTIALSNLHITHILTVIKSEIRVNENDNFVRKQIYVEDEEITDLLSVFDSCYDFIDKALSENSTNNVLVHCLAGVSRSATIACMWLMRRHSLSANDAFKRLKLARPFIQPNLSFCTQIYLFEQMNNKLDVNHELYKEFHFERARTIYIDHDTENEGIDKKNDLRQQYRQAFTLPYGHAMCTVTETYICRQCQTELFTNADLSRHSEGGGLYNWFMKYGKDRFSKLLPGVECHQQLFTNCLQWLMAQIDTPTNSHNASIKCLKCSEIIGKYDLYGARCSCGRWVMPAFHFDIDRVEKKNATNINIETKNATA